jgi:transposase-like protein
MLTKITVEAALNAELGDHLGFDKHEQTEDGQFELATTRDRAGSFEPKLVKKHQRRFASMDDKILCLWLAENEGAKVWLNVLTELQNRGGVRDILIACVDGLNGLPDAINTAYPETHIQLCIVHMVRNSMKFVSWKDYKPVATDLKQIYQSATEEEALLALNRFMIEFEGRLVDYV